jgi:hypothetical protein
MAAGLLLLAGSGLAPSCATPPVDPLRYRLTGSGSHWQRVGDDRVLDDLLPRYPEFFRVVLDPARSEEPDVRAIRQDLERKPADRRNYDALNAMAIGYFELNHRGERAREDASVGFLTAGFRAAHLAAIAWRAYGEIEDPRLRDAILDFFADVAGAEKLGTRRTRGRLTDVVASLAQKESDPQRLQRIAELTAVLSQPPDEPSSGEIIFEGDDEGVRFQRFNDEDEPSPPQP